MGSERHPCSQDQISSLEWELRHIGFLMSQKGRQILAHFPITPPQFEALQWLSEAGEMTIGELSGKMRLAFSTTTDLVDRMEASDLVRRVRDQSDRRVVRIYLEEKGRDVIREVIEKRRDYITSFVGDISDQQLNELIRALALLRNEMEKDRE